MSLLEGQKSSKAGLRVSVSSIIQRDKNNSMISFTKLWKGSTGVRHMRGSVKHKLSHIHSVIQNCTKPVSSFYFHPQQGGDIIG